KRDKIGETTDLSFRIESGGNDFFPHVSCARGTTLAFIPMRRFDVLRVSAISNDALRQQLWMRMLRSQTRPWLEFFQYLQNHGLYESDVLEDCVVFLFVFVPILRDEIATFVETWNEHRIRSQRNSANHVAGIPNELYTSDDTLRFGWTPNAQF
ncbi:hypothetical protein Egran_03852, partial [Elaphomyces granulatus]